MSRRRPKTARDWGDLDDVGALRSLLGEVRRRLALSRNAERAGETLYRERGIKKRARLARWEKLLSNVKFDLDRSLSPESLWAAAACYLFLECAELVEALRGKGDSSPEEEMADVLTVLLTIVAAFELDVALVLNFVDEKMDKIAAGKIGSGPDPKEPT